MAECKTVELSSEVRHVLITGDRDVGKTMLLLKAAEELQKQGFKIHGFYRDDFRHFGRRKGFDVVSLDGEKRAPLARVEDDGGASLNRHDPNRIGRYLVQVEQFEEFVLPVLHSSNIGVTIIDEIGQMEAFSRNFHQAVLSRLDDPRSVVFATIPAKQGRPILLVEHVRSRPDVIIFTVTKKNRNDILSNILNAMTTIATRE